MLLCYKYHKYQSSTATCSKDNVINIIHFVNLGISADAGWKLVGVQTGVI